MRSKTIAFISQLTKFAVIYNSTFCERNLNMLQKLVLALKACRIISNLSNDLIITVNIYTAEICLIYISSHFFKLANNSGFMNRSIIL